MTDNGLTPDAVPNDVEMRSLLLAIADDGLDVDRTLAVMTSLRRQRQRRRQVVSLLSAAAVVVIVVLLIGTSFGGLAAPRPVQPRPVPTAVSSSPSAPAKTTVPVKTTVSVKPTAPVTLVAFKSPALKSPVSTTAIAQGTEAEWHLEPGRLWVAWRSDASRQTQQPTSQPDESRGYVVSGASVPVPLTNQETGAAVIGKDSAATVNGHAAVLTTAPAGTVDAQGYPAQSRLSWKLPDGRTIHVFDTDPDAKTKTLLQFADSIRDVPTPLVIAYPIAVAPKGYQLGFADTGTFGNSSSLCPADQPALIGRCLTVSSGDNTQTGNGSGAQIQAEGDQRAVKNGTLYLQLSKNRAVLFGGSAGVEIDSGIPLTAAQFTAIAETLKP